LYDWFIEKGAKIKCPKLPKTYRKTNTQFENIDIHRLILNIWYDTSKYNKFYFQYLDTFYDITQQDKYKNTYLHYLAQHGYIRKTTDPLSSDYLFKKKIDVNVQNINGDTALHIRCKDSYINSNCLSIKYFPKNNETLKIRNNNGKTPLDILHDQFRMFMKNYHWKADQSLINEWYETLKYLGDDFVKDEFNIMKKKNEFDIAAAARATSYAKRKKTSLYKKQKIC